MFNNKIKRLQIALFILNIKKIFLYIKIVILFVKMYCVQNKDIIVSCRVLQRRLVEVIVCI